MSLSDPIGDMIARVKNAQARNHKKVALPSSNFKTKIADILKNEGFIKDFKIEPFRTTFTFSGIEIFIFPIFDIKIPYKLFLHQPCVFLRLYQSLRLLELIQ